MAANGVWMHPHHNWYITASHTQQDIETTLAAAALAFDAVVELAIPTKL